MKRPRRRRKTLVFEIKLSEDANDQYENNYKEMKDHEERTKKVDSDIEIIETLDDEEGANSN